MTLAFYVIQEFFTYGLKKVSREDAKDKRFVAKDFTQRRNGFNAKTNEFSKEDSGGIASL